MIGILFRGKAHLHADADNGWEPFSGAENPAEDYCAADWVEIIQRAKGLGVKVEFTPKGIKMTRGKSEGLFRDYKGGINLANRFLDEFE